MPDARHPNRKTFVIGLTMALGLLLAGVMGVLFPGIGAAAGKGSPDRPPKVSFQWDCTDLTCSFLDTTRSDDAMTSWHWDFGDGATSSDQHATHMFGHGGRFAITLTVEDIKGVVARKSRHVRVVAPDPVVSDEPPHAVFAVSCDGLTCAFTDSSTDDGAIAQWGWDFGDGGTATARHPSHTYEAAGTYTVLLTVTDDVGASDSAAQVVTVAVDDSPPGSPLVGLPYGVFFPPNEAWRSDVTAGMLTMTPSSIIEDLEMVRAAGGSVVINLLGKKASHQNPDETFNLEMWKAGVDKFAEVDLSGYVADGTILAHYMTDEPKSRGSWGGEVIPNDVLDEMARYSKSIWPELPTTLRVSPSKLARHAGGYDVTLPDWEWQYLDIGWAQYSARFGPISEYVAVEIAEADRQGLGLIFGLNVINGGDGSSGVPGHLAEKWSMSAQELREYAGALIGSEAACAFLMWRYDWDGYIYFELPEIAEATAELAATAASSLARSCDTG